MQTNLSFENTQYRTAVYLLSAVSLFFILDAHLFSAFFTGFLIYELIRILTPPFSSLFRLEGQKAKLWVVVVVAILVVFALLLLSSAAARLFVTGSENIPALMKKMAAILEGTRTSLPRYLSQYLPHDLPALQGMTITWLRHHAGDIQTLGKMTGRLMLHIIAGGVIGMLITFSEVQSSDVSLPFKQALLQRVINLGQSFHNVVFAQGQIAFLNTVFTAVLLMVIYPLFGVSIPFTKTMVALTFVFGMIPVIGNLITNTVIVIISLSHSILVAIFSLIFLIVIHKLEYFLNARIVGAHIKARAYEILIAMLVFETVFGLTGLIAAPIYYAYIKAELSSAGVI